MCYEAEPEAIPESLHLRYRNHLSSAAAQHHNMGVVDHHSLHDAVHIAHRIGEKHLAVESLKGGVDLKEQHARVTEHGRGSLRFILPAADFHFMRRGVVLHFHAGLEVILARGHNRRLPDALPAAERGQSLIRQRRAAHRKLLMDSHEIALAGSQKIQDLLAVGLGFFLPLDLRHAGAVQAQDFAHCRTRYLQCAGDLVSAHALRV